MKNHYLLYRPVFHAVTLMCLFALFMAPDAKSQSYCVSDLTYYGCSYYSAIDNFSLSNINQVGTGCQEGTGVSDYTADTCILSQGEPYLLVYSTNSPGWALNTDCLGLWIDLNDDYDFDDEGELILSSIGQTSNLVAVPAEATLGFHRMRARCKSDYNPFNANESCYTFYYSETHDYTVQIVPPPPCTSVSNVTISETGFYDAAVNVVCNSCEGPYIVEYGLPGFIPGSDENAGAGGTVMNVENSSGFPVTINGLEASTQYSVYVRKNCGADGFSANFGPVNFLTKYNACNTLTPIACGETVTAVIPTGIGQFDTSYCGVHTGKELMYSFTAGLSGIYTLTILETDWKNVSYKIKEASLGCDKENWNCAQTDPWTFTYNMPGTIILDTLSEGTEYLICIDAMYANEGATHSFRVNCYIPFEPCDSITAIACGEQQHVVLPSGLGKFSDYNNSYSFNYGMEKIYRFTPVLSGPYYLSVSSNSEAIYYSYKKASDGCAAAGWHFIAGIGSWSNYSPYLGNLVAGTEYLLIADGYNMNGADHYFQINCYEPSDPCAEADTIPCGTEVLVTIPPGPGTIALPNCPGTGYNQPFAGRENIFLFTPETSGYAAIHILDYPYPNWNNTFYYYFKPASGGCSEEGWQCIASGYNGYYKIPMYLNAGESYYVLIDALTLDGDYNHFEITIPEAWDACNTISSLACGDTVNAVIPSGVGVYDTLFYYRTGLSIGKELMYSFTPAISGTYGINVIATDYRSVKYLIKEVTTGCNGDEWQFLHMTAYPSYQPFYASSPLETGKTYLIMLDAGDYSGASISFELKCAYPANPCDNINSISVGEEVSFNNESGLGAFNPVPDEWSPYPGRETIFEFTPATSGNHLLELISASGSNSVGYFIKEAADGCNNNNWTIIMTGYYHYVAGIPISLTAGTSYYLMCDGFTAGQTFRVIGPSETWDYCSNLQNIENVGEDVSFSIPSGLGGFGLKSSCYSTSTPGKEKLFRFVAPVDGYFGLDFISASGGNVNYLLKQDNNPCSTEGWTCISQFGTYGTGLLVRFPYKFTAGHTYYIIADATDTLGFIHTFRITGPPPDPCENIELMSPCGTYFMVTMPAGINNYDFTGCGKYYQARNIMQGSVKILSFTPAENGISQFSTIYLYNATNIRFYIRPASTGCGEEGWTCIMYDPYSWRANLPYQLMKDTTYYLLIGNEYTYSTTEFGIYLSCPEPCSQFLDRDYDGYGDDNTLTWSCWPNFGYVYEGGDCDDFNPEIYPGAPEISDNLDNDCDGQTDECISLPEVSCPADRVLCITVNPLELTGGIPEGGVWSGTEVENGVFYPDQAGAGLHSITYCFTNEAGCSACCSFSIEVLEIQTITLPEGWSGISGYLEPIETEIVSIFSPVLNNLTILYNFTNIFYPGGGIVPVQPWDSQSGYVVRMEQNDLVNLCGSEINSPVINIQTGWNMIPVLSRTPVSVDGLFGSVPEVDLISEIAGYRMYWKQFSINSLASLEPGKAYFLHASAPVSVSYIQNSGDGLINPDLLFKAPWNKVTMTALNHIFVFTPLACEDFEPETEVGIFTGDGRCAGHILFSETDQAMGLIAQGDDRYTIAVDGFLPGEKVMFKLFHHTSGQVEDVFAEFDPDYPGRDAFTSGGISVIKKIQKSTLDTDRNLATRMMIYPNPGRGIFNMTGGKGPVAVCVTRPDGSVVTQIRFIQTGTIDLSGEPSGIYLVRITDEDGTVYRKVVKEL